MAGRSHRERLLKELSVIRRELSEEVQRLTPEEFDWAPRPDMKSFKAFLLEIGTMEKFCWGRSSVTAGYRAIILTSRQRHGLRKHGARIVRGPSPA
jgi:hypothetical protein